MLELHNIKKDYPMGATVVHALKGVSIQFRRSEFVSILGPSGCGKTTLLNIIGGLDQYTDGDLIINGRSTKSFQDRDWDAYRNHSVGFVFQSYNLFRNKTVLQNVTEGLIVARRMHKDQAEAIAVQMLEKVGMADRCSQYPHQLSGGQQQRVAIARALATSPEIIYFDEPTSALDPEMVGEVLSVMRDLASQGMTMLVVTHEMAFARDVSNHVVFMADGVICEQGDPKDVFTNPKQTRTREFLARFMGE